ncbi:MAG: hypothetical protein ACYYK0_01160 [Candidatus Eutrophobiaceae bacterium]
MYRRIGGVLDNRRYPITEAVDQEGSRTFGYSLIRPGIFGWRGTAKKPIEGLACFAECRKDPHRSKRGCVHPAQRIRDAMSILPESRLAACSAFQRIWIIIVP